MSVVNPNVAELLDHADSRYTLVVEASRRSRTRGLMPGPRLYIQTIYAKLS